MKAHRVARVALHLGACLSIFAVVHADGVQIVDKPGLGIFPTIQSAIDAASDGDVLVVAKGTYSGFTVDGKGLWVLAFPPSAPQSTVNGTVTVRNVPAGSTLVIAGLKITGATSFTASNPGYRMDNCPGSVVLRQCIIKGGTLNAMGFFKPPAPPGARITNCQRVFLVGCAITAETAPLAMTIPGSWAASGSKRSAARSPHTTARCGAARAATKACRAVEKAARAAGSSTGASSCRDLRSPVERAATVLPYSVARPETAEMPW
jgi:hypothetical protein